MATTTTNYGWDIPQSTDLVKDGATAIATLGQDIDTSVYTALGGNKSGLVLLNTTSFSGVTTQAVNTIFSATYTQYLIKVHISSAATDGQVWIKLRNATTDKSANYTTSVDTINSSATRNSFTNNSGSGFMIGETDAGSSNAYYSWTVQLSTPFATSPTTAQSQGAWYSATGEWRGSYGSHLHNENYSADGINLIAAGNITGVVSVYGYNV